ADAALEAGRLPHLGKILALALGLAWLRGALVCAVCLGLGLPVLTAIFRGLPLEGLCALRWSFWLFWLLGLAVAADQFWERRGLKVAAGVALALAILGAGFEVRQSFVLGAAVGAACLAGFWRWFGSRRDGLA
ncbi:MAG: hypothetical protein ACREKE_05665, partial [bacterium]